MSRFKLPDGVPLDNAGKARFGARGEGLRAPSADNKAPDMATPQFGVEPNKRTFEEDRSTETTSKPWMWPGEGWPKERPCGPAKCQQENRCDLDGCWRRPRGWNEKPSSTPQPIPPVIFVLLGATAILLAAVGAFVIMDRGDEALLCSSQPAWNQYNCMPG